MKFASRVAAATYLAERSSLTVADLLADPEAVALAFTEATSQHEINDACEHCRRIVAVRDVLNGVAPRVEGQLQL